jgi:hypothetical protein
MTFAPSLVSHRATRLCPGNGVVQQPSLQLKFAHARSSTCRLNAALTDRLLRFGGVEIRPLVHQQAAVFGRAGGFLAARLVTHQVVQVIVEFLLDDALALADVAVAVGADAAAGDLLVGELSVAAFLPGRAGLSSTGARKFRRDWRARGRRLGQGDRRRRTR